MLANPHWNAPSLSSFESWLETKDPSQSYRYSDCTNCAVAQYLKAVGKYDERWLADSKSGDMMQTLNRIAADSLELEGANHTFGGLLSRVRTAKQFQTV